ncbi:MAG: 3-phosphoshikimate 1-carboxyvinyltransferase [Victivallaceae bacterium]|nr:3-phosphoshikimate 1-carboxyvinyltransferase [Victivallaceae bacterium]
MQLTVNASHLGGEVAVPGSKSHTIRGIAAGLLSGGCVTLDSPLESDDTASALNAAARLGAVVEKHASSWSIRGTCGKPSAPDSRLDLGNSGTGLRLLSAIAALAGKNIAFDGDASLRTRPMAGLLSALTELGASTSSTGGRCPLELCGPLRGGHAKVDGTTSQFLTALLFALPAAEHDSELTLDFLNEKPYIDITLDWLDALGVRVSHSPDYLYWQIPGGQIFGSLRRTVAADFSTAAFPLIGAIAAGRPTGVTLLNLDFNDPQGDKLIFELLAGLGARIERNPGRTVVLPSPLSGGTLDLNSTPDALPAVAVAALNAAGETRLVNVPQARLKECDRIAVMTAELRKLGADIEELPDGMIIRPTRLHGGRVESHGDHRIAMALAIAGLSVADGETVIEGAEAASVTYPAFFEDFIRLGADFRLG